MEEIRDIVKDNSAKLDVIQNEVKNTNIIIKELKDNVDTLMKLNREQKKINTDIGVSLDNIKILLADIRKDIDKIMGKEYMGMVM